MYDVIVIGGGPGGYVCAMRAAQNGLKVACVEAQEFLGGTCLNEGCIPSKALLESSYHYYNALNHFADHGITASANIDIVKMQSRKDAIVKSLAGGIDMLFKKNKIDRFTGFAKFISSDEIEVGGSEKTERLQAKNFVIATGSTVSQIPGISIDEEVIVSSKGVLSLTKVPNKMVVIGGGVIGLELGCVWSRLGSGVSVIEYADRILPGMDTDITKTATTILSKQGLDIKTSMQVTEVKRIGKKAKVIAQSKDKDAAQEKVILEADVVLVCVGRKPFTANLGLENISVSTNDRGFLNVDKNYRVAQNIYAIGDVIPGPMLAHKAEDEGIAVADILAGKYGHVNYDAIPNVVYTHPEIASIGKSELQLKEMGIEYSIGKFNFAANSRAKAISETDGFVKILACKKTDRILGCSIIGKDAGNLIHEIGIIIEFSGSAEDLGMVCHAHPTLNEAIKEAALAVQKRAIHM